MNSYDNTLFKNTAWYYARYRPPYPKALFELLVNKFNLDGTGQLLDLGAGTGELAVPLSASFEKVIAVEPDREMIEEGKKRAEQANVHNIVWRQERAEGFADTPQSFRLISLEPISKPPVRVP